jgi:hypothetical protein
VVQHDGNIELKSLFGREISECKLYTITGQLLYSDQGHDCEVTISISGLKKGVYLLTYFNGGKYSSMKFFK